MHFKEGFGDVQILSTVFLYQCLYIASYYIILNDTKIYS